MQISWHRITAHTHYPFRIARTGSSVTGDGTEVERVIVELTHKGIVGRGEAAPTPYYKQSPNSVEATLAQIAPMLNDAPMLGDDPGEIDAIVDRLLNAFDDQRATVAAVDAALHDWFGKRRNMPVWKFLGLDASKTPPTSMTIGIDRLDLLPEKVAAATGFHVLKIKVGTDRDAETLTALRKLAPKQRIRVDANCGWPPEEVVTRLQPLLPFDLELIEQPTTQGKHAATRAAREVSTAPLIADEDSVTVADVARLTGVYDGINVKLSKCGGIREGLRMIKAARAHSLKVMLGCMVETSLGVSPAAHLASLVDYVDLDGHLLLRDDPFSGLTLTNGVVAPGPGAGLGIVPGRKP